MIDGLTLITDYITPEAETDLLAQVDSGVWLTDLKRRVQHHGYRYDYRARRVDASMHLGDLPAWAAALATCLHDDGHIAAVPDQVIVNEYEPGQGIALHVDCIPCFDDTILSLTLGSGCTMTFTQDDTKHTLYLNPRSLLVMRGEARYDWKHGIPARKSDMVNGQRVARERRVSLTFRRVVLADITGSSR